MLNQTARCSTKVYDLQIDFGLRAKPCPPAQRYHMSQCWSDWCTTLHPSSHWFQSFLVQSSTKVWDEFRLFGSFASWHSTIVLYSSSRDLLDNPFSKVHALNVAQMLRRQNSPEPKQSVSGLEVPKLVQNVPTPHTPTCFSLRSICLKTILKNPITRKSKTPLQVWLAVSACDTGGTQGDLQHNSHCLRTDQQIVFNKGGDGSKVHPVTKDHV